MIDRRSRRVPRRRVGTKTCSRCKKDKPVSAFYARRYTFDGLMAECKTCNDARPRTANPPKTHGFKTCSGCKKRMPLTAFAVAKTGKNGRHCYCRDCDAIRRKVTRYGISLDEYHRLASDAGNACQCCRTAFSEQRQVCLDHCSLTKRIRGLLCKPCNCLVEKGDDSRLAIIRRGQAYLKTATTRLIVPAGRTRKEKGSRDG
jgi:hypothetical protein